MSFMLTTQQINDKSKTVTRRLGWQFLKVGDIIQPVEKCQGLGKGGKIVKIGGPIQVTMVNREPLPYMWINITAEAAKEGFPGMSHADFTKMFTKANKCDDNSDVTRIEFKYLD
jgi:hypothetical protein